MRVNRIGLVLLLVSSVASARAQGSGESLAVMPNDIVWKAPPVSPGPDTAVTYGDPSKPGVYVMRVRFTAGFKLMPHFHPDEWRTGVVLLGNYHFGLGERWRGNRSVYRHGADGPYAHPTKAMMGVRHS